MNRGDEETNTTTDKGAERSIQEVAENEDTRPKERTRILRTMHVTMVV